MQNVYNLKNIKQPRELTLELGKLELEYFVNLENLENLNPKEMKSQRMQKIVNVELRTKEICELGEL